MKNLVYDSHKLFLLLILLGLISPLSLSFAQDGSSGLPSDPTPVISESKAGTSTSVVPSTPGVVESQATLPAPAAPRAVVPESAVTPISPVPTTPSPTSPVPATTSTPTENTGDSSNNPVLWAALGVLALLPFGYMVAQSLKNKKTEENKKEGQCFNIKKLLDEKLEKLTDLKGAVEGKMQDKAKEKIRALVKGTSAGDILALVEATEKEYEKLKKLYEKCMMDLETNKRAIIVHGWDSHPGQAWLPWIKKELESKGYKVEVPTMPHTENPTIDDWVKYLSDTVGKPDKNTFFIGHSIGCQTILRYAETLKEPIGGAIFVAGWFNLDNLETEEEKVIAKPWNTTPIDFSKVREVLPKSTLIISDNDPYGAFEENKKKFSELGSKIVVLHEAGHINGESGYSKLPEAIAELENL
jgi:predicted alpha/beta hydrolase family esterase/uncharacterized protein YoaH (UPF0181 family)